MTTTLTMHDLTQAAIALRGAAEMADQQASAAHRENRGSDAVAFWTKISLDNNARAAKFFAAASEAKE